MIGTHNECFIFSTSCVVLKQQTKKTWVKTRGQILGCIILKQQTKKTWVKTRGQISSFLPT